MHRLLIVEDEFFELAALQYELESLYPNQFEIFTAEDGILALSICEEQAPDLVLVDLNIPGLSGLELIRTLNAHHFSGKILITTAHDHSSYIREALSLGVVDYLLKPLQPNQLKASIDKCIQKLKEESQFYQKTLTLQNNIASLFSYVNTYLVRDILSDHAPAHLLHTTYNWPKDGFLQLCFLCWRFEEQEDSSFVSQWIIECEHLLNKHFFVLSSGYEESILFLIQSKTLQSLDALSAMVNTYALILSAKISNGTIILSPFYQNYHALSQAFPDFFSRGQKTSKKLLLPSVQFSHSIFTTQEERRHLRQKFVQKLREHQATLLVQSLKRKASDPRIYWEVVSLFLEAVFYYDSCADLPSLLQIFQSENPYGKLLSWLEQYYLTCRQDSPSLEETSGSIQTALAIMNQRFCEDLSQNDVAAEIGLNPTYLSHLFKQERGKSFVQELSEIRIHHAQKLLQENKYTVEQIASKCGYNSKKYFLESFKRVTGLTLTQYLHKDS